MAALERTLLRPNVRQHQVISDLKSIVDGHGEHVSRYLASRGEGGLVRRHRGPHLTAKSVFSAARLALEEALNQNEEHVAQLVFACLAHSRQAQAPGLERMPHDEGHQQVRPNDLDRIEAAIVAVIDILATDEELRHLKIEVPLTFLSRAIADEDKNIVRPPSMEAPLVMPIDLGQHPPPQQVVPEDKNILGHRAMEAPRMMPHDFYGGQHPPAQECVAAATHPLGLVADFDEEELEMMLQLFPPGQD